MLDRAPQRQSFDIDASLRDVPEIGSRNRADTKTALVGSLHQPVGDQPRQRLAHRSETDRKLLGESGNMQLLGWPSARFSPKLNPILLIDSQTGG